MKKLIGVLAAVALLVGLMAVAAAASNPGDGIPDSVGADPVGTAWGFVDDNADGISDNFVDANEDGVCDNFVDADGDGINDLRGTRGAGLGYGPHGSGTCSAGNFVDADGDGVCDNAGNGRRLGRRMQQSQNR